MDKGEGEPSFFTHQAIRIFNRYKSAFVLNSAGSNFGLGVRWIGSGVLKMISEARLLPPGFEGNNRATAESL